jgi:lysozyme
MLCAAGLGLEAPLHRKWLHRATNPVISPAMNCAFRALAVIFCILSNFSRAQVLSFRTVDRLPAGELLNPGLVPKDIIALRTVYPRGLSVTKLAEGWEPYLYNDAAGYCTIGYGHLIKKERCNGSEPSDFRKGLTMTGGDTLLLSDLESARYAVSSSVTVPLTDGQFAALTDFVFNVGGGNFRKSTILKMVNGGQSNRVSGQFRRWVLARGKTWPGLVKRREREVEIFYDGIFVSKDLPLPGEDLSPLDIGAQ